MKIFKFMLLAVAALGFSSCVSEELQTADTRQGSMSLVVDKLAPKPTRAVETDNFPVNIKDLDGKLVHSYNKASEVPFKIKLAVGKYYAEAHTPGDLEKYMDAPYYYGRDDFEILQAVNTNSKVTCRMANGSITVRFGNDEAEHNDFMDLFTDWTITISDSKESTLILSKEDHGYEPPTTYIKFAENVEVLTMNFTGKTKNDATIKTSHNLTKDSASETYDNDETSFSGGDIISVTLAAVAKTDGDIVGISVNANIKFEESEENFDMEVEDNTDNFEEWEDPETPEETGPITLKLPNHMVIDSNTDPALGNTLISAENGIKSIMVKISSNSDAMIGSLQQMIDGYPAATFLEGAEIVGNQDIVRLFGDLGQTLEVPAEGDTEYVFPIGNFFQLLAVLEGVHTFDMVVTDMEGNVKKGKLVLAVGCALPEIEEEPEQEEPASNITLQLPKDMTITMSTDPSLGDALIECATGIQSIMVKINSDSQDMMGSLELMTKNYEGVDFINGAEIVANTELVRLFTELGQELDVPAVGDNSYTFPIGNFFSLLAVMPGDHTFYMVVTDADGATKSGKLTLTVE